MHLDGAAIKPKKRVRGNVIVEALSFAQIAILVLVLVLLLGEERLAVGSVPA